MNLDRPLDELVKESLAAKRADRADKRNAFRPKRAPAPNTNQPAPNAAAAPNGSAPNQPNTSTSPNTNADTNPNPNHNAAMHLDTRKKDRLGLRRRPGIAKKRRMRKRAFGDMQIDTGRKTPSAPAPALSRPAASSLVSSALPRGKAVKVVVSNLHPQVSQTDIAELFENVGPLKSATLQRYPNGSSACEADVFFENMPDALEAIKRYNNVPLDNQPLHITLVTTRAAKGRRPPQKKFSAQPNDDYRSPDNEHENGFNDRASPDRTNGPRRRPGRRWRYNNRPDDRQEREHDMYVD